MKRYALSLLCLGLAGLAWAADAPPTLSPAPDGTAAAPACEAPRCGEKVCVSVPGTKKKDVVIYDDKCVDYCLPHCSFYSLFWGSGCGDCGCLNCGHPRVKHVLIKKIVHEECPETKCEIKEIGPCGTEAPSGPAPVVPSGK